MAISFSFGAASIPCYECMIRVNHACILGYKVFAFNEILINIPYLKGSIQTVVDTRHSEKPALIQSGLCGMLASFTAGPDSAGKGPTLTHRAAGGPKRTPTAAKTYRN